MCDRGLQDYDLEHRCTFFLKKERETIQFIYHNAWYLGILIKIVRKKTYLISGGKKSP